MRAPLRKFLRFGSNFFPGKRFPFFHISAADISIRISSGIYMVMSVAGCLHWRRIMRCGQA